MHFQKKNSGNFQKSTFLIEKTKIFVGSSKFRQQNADFACVKISNIKKIPQKIQEQKNANFFENEFSPRKKYHFLMGFLKK